MNNTHFYYKFELEPDPNILSQMVVDILNFYSRKNLSKKKWKKEKEFSCKYQPNRDEPDKWLESNLISYQIILEHLKNCCYSFDPNSFKLFPYECYWLDHTIDMQWNFHKFDEGSTEALTLHLADSQQMYGQNYPIHLKLDREGHLYSSMQRPLINRIISMRNRLVYLSSEALSVDWIFDLRNLIADTVSLVDITLNQFYNKAEYDPLPSWEFDKQIVGEKFGRRFKDKLKWVHQITGVPLDNAEKELKSFNSLREIRNHLMHFDPPSLVIPLEEVKDWLNQIRDVAFLLKKIRDKIGVSGSTSLTNLMLQRDVIFVPHPHSVNRLPLNSAKTGYLSSRWPN